MPSMPSAGTTRGQDLEPATGPEQRCDPREGREVEADDAAQQ